MISALLVLISKKKGYNTPGAFEAPGSLGPHVSLPTALKTTNLFFGGQMFLKPRNVAFWLTIKL